MSDLVKMNVDDESISILFDVGEPKIMGIGTKMNEICDEAYMNGYNWEAFFNCYLSKNNPEILDIIESDPEADMYCVYFEDVNEETTALAEEFKGIIEELFENEDGIYSFLEDNAEDIEWD